MGAGAVLAHPTDSKCPAHIPFQSNLRGRFCFGKPLTIEGRVLRGETQHPVSEALVEIWHPDQNGKFGRYAGKMRTDKNGFYRFQTILPGQYYEKNYPHLGTVFFAVQAAGYPRQESKLYFNSQGQCFIDGTHWAASPIGKRNELPYTQTAGSGEYVTHFLHRLSSQNSHTS